MREAAQQFKVDPVLTPNQDILLTNIAPADRSKIEASGFQIAKFLPRTFLCGFGFDHVIRSKRLIAWNAKVSDHLPAQCASAWMFVLTPTQAITPYAYKRGYGARLRRYLNEKRWKLR
jgi:hypothetical protein